MVGLRSHKQGEQYDDWNGSDNDDDSIDQGLDKPYPQTWGANFQDNKFEGGSSSIERNYWQTP